MRLQSLGLLLTYRCVYRCEHCYVFGSPEQQGAMGCAEVRRILADAAELGTVEEVHFDGGEPFLYFPVLLEGVREAKALGFRVTAHTNGDWASDEAAAVAWLDPLREARLDRLVVSRDRFHIFRGDHSRADRALAVAANIGIEAEPASEALEHNGRAALALGLALGGKTLPGTRPWSAWTSCAHGRVRDPRAVWVDPFGNVHLCHGVLIGSLWWNSLADLVHGYDPDSDPVLGPLARGGPAALVEEHGLPLRGRFADACHLCFLARRELRGRFPERLGPDAVYGAAEVPEETR